MNKRNRMKVVVMAVTVFAALLFTACQKANVVDNEEISTVAVTQEEETSTEEEITAREETSTEKDQTEEEETTPREETSTEKDPTEEEETTPREEATAEENTTPREEATEEEKTNSREEATEEENTTPREEATEEENTTPREETTPEEEKNTEKETTAEENTTPEEETTPKEEITIEEKTAPEEEITPKEEITAREETSTEKDQTEEEETTQKEETTVVEVMTSIEYVQTTESSAQEQIQASTSAGHEHSYSSVVIQSADCMREKIVVYTCSCGDTYTETFPKSDHVFKWYTYNNDATTEADGTMSAPCIYECGTIYTTVCPGTKINSSWYDEHTQALDTFFWLEYPTEKLTGKVGYYTADRFNTEGWEARLWANEQIEGIWNIWMTGKTVHWDDDLIGTYPEGIIYLLTFYLVD